MHWYTLRWVIERFHYVLKSGCHIEQLQLETAARLQRALATYALVAWRLLWLTYQARVPAAQPASPHFAPEENPAADPIAPTAQVADQPLLRSTKPCAGSPRARRLPGP